jgi:hypothetical protein
LQKGLGPGCALPLLFSKHLNVVGSVTPALRSLKGLEGVAEGLGPGCTVPLLLLSMGSASAFKHGDPYLEEWCLLSI